MGDPDAAAHVLGKLLVAFGPERILWGTDSIWYGSPQDQIAAFRAFEITPALPGAVRLPGVDRRRQATDHGGQRRRAVRDHRAGAGLRARAPGSAGIRPSNRTYGPVARRDVVATFLREHPWIAAAQS